ncbi:FAD:protein FMN transferase [uncultured Bradyrhizobium sp.]|uniref:FAD:protein FMN transferase n=1 Tax=Bradyrhizobium sp. TaxID=376 RepID=UPI00261FF75B|nr:FAD:protein FMN transferase [uncultured Bradyrhizobium sp.]
MRRARPLLGTFVEISAVGLAELALVRAVDAAFAAVARVHRLMSFRDPDSDLSRLNRQAASRPVVVDPWTASVLRRARSLFDATDGLFDCAVGHEAMQRGSLPSQGLGHVRGGTFAAVELMSDDRVRFSANIALDFGGIAKGFAVDRAIGVLRAHGVREALVNAGGDMRVIGETAQPVYIRCPGEDRQIVQAGLLRNAAIATSAAVLTVCKGAAEGTLRSIQPPDSAYSVIAPTCLLADALTKVLVQIGRADVGYFARFGVQAFITSAAANTEKVA